MLKYACHKLINCLASSPRFSVAKESPDSADSTSIEYRCRKCRKVLFNDKHIMRHKVLTPGTVTGDGTTETMDCSFGYFTSPMEWMSLIEHRGKVSFLLRRAEKWFDSRSILLSSFLDMKSFQFF